MFYVSFEDWKNKMFRMKALKRRKNVCTLFPCKWTRSHKISEFATVCSELFLKWLFCKVQENTEANNKKLSCTKI